MNEKPHEKIIIDDEDKTVFNSLWECHEDNISFQTDDGENIEADSILNNFIEYLSQKYKFNPNSFSVYDKQGDLIHSRTTRTQESVN